jgi:EAL domain-containing protein (putative c-di-GMP-specific phosphodiesterase class I)
MSPLDLRRVVDQAVQLHRLARMKREALEAMGVPGGAADRAGLAANFERALASLWVAFQPIVSASRRTVYGYEGLLRTREATLSEPQQVLDAAEQLDSLGRVGRAVRRSAAAAVREADGHPTLFVNLHPTDLYDPELVDERSPLVAIAESVVLEITERAALASVDDTRARVAELRRLGFRIAIDDLGAGYSGLNSFALLEPEVVKLDMGLIRDIDTSPVKRKVVGSMTSLCKDMGMLVVAEGVETADERDTLVALGCDLLQGFLFARPGLPFPSVRL